MCLGAHGVYYDGPNFFVVGCFGCLALKKSNPKVKLRVKLKYLKWWRKKFETSTRNGSLTATSKMNKHVIIKHRPRHTYECAAHQRVYCFPAVIIHGPEKEIIMLELCVSGFFVFNSIRTSFYLTFKWVYSVQHKYVHVLSTRSAVYFKSIQEPKSEKREKVWAWCECNVYHIVCICLHLNL